MKRIFSTILLIAVLFIANLPMNAQSNLIRNSEEKDGLIVSETVFKLEEGTLVNYMKHNYKYDENKQRIEDEALKWNVVSEKWVKDLCLRYSYTEKSITTEYYKWNKKKKDYILVPEMTITMDK
jgi:hypothetical protein